MNLILSLVILFAACINFINLTTAYSLTRLKEIVIRKSVGANKRQLIVQFLSETYLLLFYAFYLGLFLAEHLVPMIGQTFGIEIESNYKGLDQWLLILVIYLVTGLIAGLYPAIKISGFKPMAFLTGKNTEKHTLGKRSRKVLIVIQFTFSILLTIISIFMIRQYAYMKEADLGFNREDVIYIRTNGKVWDQFDVIKKELSDLHFVEDVSSGSAVPVKIDHGEIDWGEREGITKSSGLPRTLTSSLSTWRFLRARR